MPERGDRGAAAPEEGDPTLTSMPGKVQEDAPDIPGVELTLEIGRGGMGVVYKGKQTYIDRDVAVKLLLSEKTEDDFVQRFRREARILASMTHPNIVGCYQAGLTEAGNCFLVMEFIDGPDLKQWILHNGRLAPDHALTVCRDVAADGERVIGGQAAVVQDPLLEVRPVDELHHQEAVARFREAGLVAPDDVRMRHRREDPSLAAEALDEVVLGLLGQQQLDRHVAVDVGLLTLVDDPHAAAADLEGELDPRDVGRVLLDLAGHRGEGGVPFLGRGGSPIAPLRHPQPSVLIRLISSMRSLALGRSMMLLPSYT